MGTASRLLREDRERLWSRHQQLCDEVKRLQDQSRRDREAESQVNRDRIWVELKSARPICGWANSVDDLKEAETYLAKAMDLMNNKSLFLTREHRNECWAEWKVLKRVAAEKRDRLWRDRSETKRDKMLEIVQHKEEYIGRVQNQIDDLDEQMRSARTEEHANRVRAWIQEKHEKIRAVQGEIVDLHEKIRDLTARLRG